MIGFIIVAKNGLLLYKHSFFPEFRDLVDDLLSGLMTAVVSMSSELKAGAVSYVKLEDQEVLVSEGERTYGFFFTTERDDNLPRFARSIITDFEREFTKELDNMEAVESTKFERFQEIADLNYDSLFHIDIEKLQEIIPHLQEFDNVILLERPFYHQVYTALKDPNAYDFLKDVLSTTKAILKSPITGKINKLKGQRFFRHVYIEMSKDHDIYIEDLNKYILILLLSKQQSHDIFDIQQKVQNIRKLTNL